MHKKMLGCSLITGWLGWEETLKLINSLRFPKSLRSPQHPEVPQLPRAPHLPKSPQLPGCPHLPVSELSHLLSPAALGVRGCALLGLLLVMSHPLRALTNPRTGTDRLKPGMGQQGWPAGRAADRAAPQGGVVECWRESPLNLQMAVLGIYTQTHVLLQFCNNSGLLNELGNSSAW